MRKARTLPLSKLLLASATLFLATSCAGPRVTDRRYVMDRFMEGGSVMDGPDVNVENYREGAQGGTGGSAGGGCGCN